VTVYLFILFLYPHFRDACEENNTQSLEQNTYYFLHPTDSRRLEGRKMLASRYIKALSSTALRKGEEEKKGVTMMLTSFFLFFLLGIYIGRHSERRKEEGNFAVEVAYMI